jgi:Fe-S-cluster-containing dehydrogenase component
MACPFGVPIKKDEQELMMKCNMCYDRTSAGLKPMCATVCPSSALFYGTAEEVEEKRPNSTPVNKFIFGDREVITKVNVMMPKGSTELKIH